MDAIEEMNKKVPEEQGWKESGEKIENLQINIICTFSVMCKALF